MKTPCGALPASCTCTTFGALSSRQSMRFAQQALIQFAAGDQVGMHHFEGDLPTEVWVLRLVHDAHAPSADLGADAGTAPRLLNRSPERAARYR